MSLADVLLDHAPTMVGERADEGGIRYRAVCHCGWIGRPWFLVDDASCDHACHVTECAQRAPVR